MEGLPAMRTIFNITNWSPVPGDQAFVEADHREQACARLWEALQESDDALHALPRNRWRAVPVDRPLFVVWRRD
jgi:hypothetical protein